MIRYRHDPERPDEPIVEATPRDLDGYRSMVRAYVRSKWPVFGSDVEDVAQTTMIIACRLVAEERLRGTYTTPVHERVKSFLIDIAWRVASNEAAKIRTRRGRGETPYDAVAAERIPDKHTTLDEQLDARRALSIVGKELGWRAAEFAVLIATGEVGKDIARRLQIEPSTLHAAARRARRYLAEELARKPKQAPPRSPRDRKKKR